MANTTYGQMQARISDELGGRPDLLAAASGLTESPIQLAIQDAISYWEGSRFYFNEYRTAGAFNTVQGQEFYTSADWADITTIQHIDKLSVLISNNRYYMAPRTEQYMEDISISPTNTGQPVDYAYYNFQLRFYPIPDQAYPVNVLGTKKFAQLSVSADTNVWTTEAEPLIRATAKLYLYRDTLRDDLGAAVMDRAMTREERSLRSETFNKIASYRVRPTYF